MNTTVIADNQEVFPEQLKKLLKEQAPYLPKWQAIDVSADSEMAELAQQLSSNNVPISLALHCNSEDAAIGLLIVINSQLYELRVPSHAADKIGTAVQAAAAKAEIMRAEAVAERNEFNNWNALLALHRIAYQVTGNAESAIAMAGKVYKDALQSKEIIDREVTAALLERLEVTTQQARKDFCKESEPSE